MNITDTVIKGVLKGEGADLALRPPEKILTCLPPNFKKVVLPSDRFALPFFTLEGSLAHLGVARPCRDSPHASMLLILI